MILMRDIALIEKITKRKNSVQYLKVTFIVVIFVEKFQEIRDKILNFYFINKNKVKN